jgi:hypothetical protein
VKRPSIKTISLLANVILLVALFTREAENRLGRFQMEHEAPSWAGYAGAMQAIADYGNGVRRFYRPTFTNDLRAKSSFTGQFDQGAEVWSWIYFGDMGEASRLSAVAFTEAYNARMMNFMKDPSSFTRNGAAATQPAR